MNISVVGQIKQILNLKEMMDLIHKFLRGQGSTQNSHQIYIFILVSINLKHLTQFI